MPHTAESVTAGLDLSGKRVLVTGATSGLGREAARVFALRGARVWVACRDIDKGRHMVEELEGELEVLPCELTSMGSVRALADSIESADVVMLNAGVFGVPFQLTEDGFERTYAANYLGHFLLVHRLLARGALRPGARIVSTLSEGVHNPLAKVDLQLLAKPTRGAFSKMMASPATKILLARMAVELTRRAATAGVDVCMNGASPPATLTDNVNQGGPVLRALGRAIGPLVFKRVEEGAAVLVWAATSPDLAGVSGKAFGAKLSEASLPDKCTDAELARESWDASVGALDLPSWP